ncbi:MAG TPA: hypothetical protein VHF22_07680 [Planctomycetota bacterium]|nr:hypothetical protein [Planctomycetota bacterium]
MRNPALGLALALAVVLGGAASSRAATITQDFTSDPGWTATGSAFGYRTTGNASGSAGEAGGTFGFDSPADYYADTRLLPLDASDSLSASGVLRIASIQANYNNNVNLGYFDPAALAGGNQGLGIAILESSTTSNRVFVVVGSALHQIETISGIGVTRTWSFAYDPLLGSFGRVTATISGSGGGTQSYDLTAQECASLGTFHAFGIVDAAGGQAGADMTMYVDSLVFTGAEIPGVPEPATVGLAIIAGALALERRLRRG